MNVCRRDVRFTPRKRTFVFTGPTLFFLAPNTLIHKASAILYFSLLLLRPLFALAHLRRPVGWHHLFRRRGPHTIRYLRWRGVREKHRKGQCGGECGQTVMAHE